MSFKFEECISTRVNSISRVIDQVYRKHLSGTETTESQLSILFVLYDKGKVEQKVVSDFLKLEKSSLTRNLSRLIQKGYVIKEGPVNRPILELTPSGKTKVLEIKPKWQAAMEELYELLGENAFNSLKLIENGLS